MYSIYYNVSYERLRDSLPESCVCVEAAKSQNIKVLDLDLVIGCFQAKIRSEFINKTK